jgi:hypothetical protein
MQKNDGKDVRREMWRCEDVKGDVEERCER